MYELAQEATTCEAIMQNSWTVSDGKRQERNVPRMSIRLVLDREESWRTRTSWCHDDEAASKRSSS